MRMTPSESQGGASSCAALWHMSHGGSGLSRDFVAYLALALAVMHIHGTHNSCHACHISACKEARLLASTCQRLRPARALQPGLARHRRRGHPTGADSIRLALGLSVYLRSLLPRPLSNSCEAYTHKHTHTDPSRIATNRPFWGCCWSSGSSLPGLLPRASVPLYPATCISTSLPMLQAPSFSHH